MKLVLLIIFILHKYYCYSEIVVKNVSVSDVYSAFIYIQSLTKYSLQIIAS